MDTVGRFASLTGSNGRAAGGPGSLSRRRFLGGLGAAAFAPAALSLAGCGGGSSGGADGELTFVYYGDADLQKDYDKLFTKFKQDHPDIKLKAQGIAADSWAEFANTVSTRLAGGQPLDVVQIATEGQRIFASKELLEPLDEYIGKDQELVDEYYEDTPPQLKEWLSQYASPDGKTYFIPGGYNTMAAHVSGEVFSKAGVEMPDDEWTWDDLRTMGRTIKDKTGAYLIPAGNGYFADVMPWLLTNGASTLNDKWDTATYDSPEAIEALTFVRSLVVDGLAPKPGGEFDAATLMSQGKLAIFGAGRWGTNDLRRLKAIDGVELLPWPKQKAPGSPVGWDAWPILKGSKNKDAAWTLIKYMMSEEFGDTITTGGGAAVPARVSDATSDEFLEDAPENTELLSELLEVATPIPSPNRGAECQKVIEEAWLQGVSGTKQPDAALKEANTKLQELLA